MSLITKLPRSHTVNEGITNVSTSTVESEDASSHGRASGSKSMWWGWLGFGASQPASASTSGAAASRQKLSGSSSGVATGSSSLRRWASLVAERPPGGEEPARPSSGEPDSCSTETERPKKLTEVLPKGSIRYEVSDGDTLQSIAVKLNVTVGEITKLNRFTTRILFPGQVINVPDPNYVPEPPVAFESSTTAALQADQDTDEKASRVSDEINEDYECVEKFVKARTLYLPNKSLEDAVPGTLLVTPNAVMFDPMAVAAAVDQLTRDSKPLNESDERSVSPTPSKSPALPPGDLLLPMSWIASVTIFRQIPGSTPAQPLGGRQRISSSPASGSRQNKNASVASIGEEIEAENVSAVENSNMLSCSPPNVSATDNAFDQSPQQHSTPPDSTNSSTPQSASTAATNSSSTPQPTSSNSSSALQTASAISASAAGAAGAAGAAISTTANKAVAAVSESAIAITEMSSQIAGAIGTPLKRISLGTLARVEPAISQSVEKLTDVVPLSMPTRRLTSSLKRALSLQQSGGDVHLSDPAAPTSLFLRITGTAWLTDDSLVSLGINNVSTASLSSVYQSAVPAHPEYWFRVPAKCARGLQLFFTHWNPEMAGISVPGQTSSGQNNPGASILSSGRSRVIGFRPPDSINRSPDGILESSYKEWEVLSIDESVKRNQAEDAEIRRNLPLPEMLGKSAFLSDDHVRELCAILPPICIGATWSLLYSSANDGFSLSTLFRAAQNADSPQLLVVHDLAGSVFGAISSCQLRVSDHFYGSSECCLFTFFPTFRVFRWSGENTFFIKGNRESLSFGSASGVIGLWLDSDLYRGRTQRCATFNNDLLTSAEDFTIEVVELWGFPS